MLENFRPCGAFLDTYINAFVAGSGTPMLLLHGYPQNLYEWAEVAPILAGHHTVVCSDLRGYGDSGKPEVDGDNYSFHAMAKDQRDLMRSLGYEHFSVIGHDRGARVALALAQDHPEAVTHLGLLDIVPTEEVFKQTDAAIAASYWHWYFLQKPSPYPEGLIAGNPAHYFDGFFASIGKMSAEETDNEQFASYRKTWLDPDFIRATCEDYRTNGAAAQREPAFQAKRVDCPALVAWGTEGVLPVHFDLKELWDARLTDATYVPMPGGHYFIDQFPKETARIILEFLQPG